MTEMSEAKNYSDKKRNKLKGSNNPNRSFDVSYYRLQLDTINPKTKMIFGEVLINAKSTGNLKTKQIDIHRNMKISYLELITKAVRIKKWKQEDDFLLIELSSPLQKDSLFSLEIDFFGSPIQAVNPPWQGGLVWRNDSLDRDWIGVACEGLGASTWWPCKDIWSDEPDSMDLFFTIPSSLRCISNGNLAGLTKVSDKLTTWHWQVKQPINLYNVTFNIGHY